MENKFANYISKVPQVSNRFELARLIATLGLYNHEDAEPGFRTDWMPEGEKKGVWQNPIDLAEMLWGMKTDFKAMDVGNFLEIGTFAGYTFFAILHFLKAHVNPNIQGTTIDIVPLDNTDPIYPYISDHFVVGTSESIRENSYDIVFVDGASDRTSLTSDLVNVNTSKLKVFLNTYRRQPKSNAQKEVQETIMSFYDKSRVYATRFEPCNPLYFVIQ